MQRSRGGGALRTHRAAVRRFTARDEGVRVRSALQPRAYAVRPTRMRQPRCAFFFWRNYIGREGPPKPVSVSFERSAPTRTRRWRFAPTEARTRATQHRLRPLVGCNAPRLRLAACQVCAHGSSVVGSLVLDCCQRGGACKSKWRAPRALAAAPPAPRPGRRQRWRHWHPGARWARTRRLCRSFTLCTRGALGVCFSRRLQETKAASALCSSWWTWRAKAAWLP